jgi:hypothetical protein
MNGIALDLTKTHLTRTHGDVICHFTWFGADADGREPCIVLQPTFRILAAGNYKPCVIALSSAYKYADDEYLMQSAINIAEILGLGQSAAFKIATIINDGLLELIKMPPKPVEQQIVVADAFLTNESGKKQHFEMTEDV